MKDQSLFIEKAYINGEWVDAKSGETFEVHGKTKLNIRLLDGSLTFCSFRPGHWKIDRNMPRA